MGRRTPESDPDPDSLPLIQQDLTYPGRDGETPAFLARPGAGGPWPAVVLLSGMNGLSRAQKDITRTYAKAGFVALSPDLLGPVAPNRMARLLAVNGLDFDRAVDRVLEGVAYLHTLDGVGPDGRIGVMGFSLGGGLALLAAARGPAISAAVIYHQSLYPDPRDLEGIACRLQCHYGSRDRIVIREEVAAFTGALDRLGKSHECHVYEGMKQSFAKIAPDAVSASADLPEERREAAALSYARSFRFLREELAPRPARRAGVDR